MDPLNVALLVAAAVVIALGLTPNLIKRTPLSEPLVALAVGVLVGPQALGWLNPDAWGGHKHTILEEAARLALAIAVMAIAVRTPPKNYTALLRPVALLVTLGMLAMWLASGTIAYAVLGVVPLVALLIGAILTPTDPIVASSIATGPFAHEHLPDRLRSTLSLESGANDGLAYLLVLLPVLLLEHAPYVGGHGPGGALGTWLMEALIMGVLAAIAIGAALGYAAGRALHLADTSGAVEQTSLLSFTVALSLLVVAAAKLAGSNGILAAFAAGVALNLAVDRREEHEEQNVQEAISRLFNLPIFVLIGLMLPWQDWARLGWAGIGLALLVLAVRRPLALLLLSPVLGRRLERRDVAFLGWFSPIGVSAVYYAMLATHRTGVEAVWPAVSLVVAASVIAHGVTAAPVTRLYAGGGARRRREEEEATA